VLAASQGGQIVLTQAVVDLIGEAWPDGVTRRDLGVRQLRDVTMPLQLWQALAPDLAAMEQPGQVLQLAASVPVIDWGETIDVPALYGREAELAALEQWVLTDRCRVVALIGLGGIGKTSVAINFARHVAPQFEAVCFRSLRNAPPFRPLLDTLIHVVSAQQATSPERVADKISRLVELLRERRSLVILDNIETIMQTGDHTGDYRAEYADYGDLIRRLAEGTHQSCLLLTSREKSSELGPLEGRATPVRTLLLGSLPERAGRTILEEKEVYGSDAEAAALVHLYGGNPLALKLVSEPIREVFGGNVGAFLAAGDPFFNGVGKLLEQQFARSAPVEQALLYWLTIERDLVPLDRLLTDLVGTAAQRDVLHALESLRRRLLIERGAGQATFTLQSVIMEYLTDRLVEQVCTEIVDGRLALLRTHALVQATTRDYVRRSQERLIAMPLLEQLASAVGDIAEQRLLQLLERWRGSSPAEQGYGPGNVVNLLRLMRGDVRGLDFSDLVIRQAYLQEVEAQDARLSGATLTQAVLGEGFEYCTCLAFDRDGTYLAASTQGGEVRLWRVADRTPLLSLPAHTGGAYGVAIAADGHVLVSSAIDGTAKVWSVPSGAMIVTLQGHIGGVYCVALTADQQLAASGGADGTVRLWDVRSGACRAVLQGHDGAVWDVAFAPDGQLLVSSSIDGSVKMWQVPSGACLATLQGHRGPVWGVALRSDSQLLASGGADGTIRLWDVPTGVCEMVLEGHTGGVRGVALSADGRLLASGGWIGRCACGMCRLVHVWPCFRDMRPASGMWP